MFMDQKAVNNHEASLVPEEEVKGYDKYVANGGIINEQVYQDTLAKMKEPLPVVEAGALKMPAEVEADVQKASYAGQAKNIADTAGIDLGSDFAHHPIVLAYTALRSETNKDKEKYHHSQMSDQQLFVEALRMQGDEESVKKCVEAYPNIEFTYTKK